MSHAGGLPERIDPEFIRYVWTFQRARRPGNREDRPFRDEPAVLDPRRRRHRPLCMQPCRSTNEQQVAPRRRRCSLVADVEQYPKFVPLCEQLAVAAGDDGGGDPDRRHGHRLRLIRETCSASRARHAALSIGVSYLEGRSTPRRRVAVRPRRRRHAASIDYEFKSRLLAGLMGCFDTAFQKVQPRFLETRADEVTGLGKVVLGPSSMPVLGTSLTAQHPRFPRESETRERVGTGVQTIRE